LLINPPFENLRGFSIGSVASGLLCLTTVLNKNGYMRNVYYADRVFERNSLRDEIIGRRKRKEGYVENPEKVKDPTC
jgi:hypothetical protein